MSRPLLLVVLAALIVPAEAVALPVVSGSMSQIPLGQTAVFDLLVDPGGIPAGAFNLQFSVSDPDALRVDDLDVIILDDWNAVESGPDLAGRFSFDGQSLSPSVPLTLNTLVATVTATGLLPGGELWLDLGNVTHNDTFQDFAIAPVMLAVVIPEPGTLVLLGAGMGALSGLRRRSIH